MLRARVSNGKCSKKMIKICSPYLIRHNHDEENLVEARIWESLQERNVRKVPRGANSQISLEGKICYDVRTNCFCTVMPNAPYQHPLLKSIIFMYLKVLKLGMHVHIEYWINKNDKILKCISIWKSWGRGGDRESKCGKLNSINQQPIELGGKSTCVIIIISLFILQFSSFLIFSNDFGLHTI